MVLMKHLFNRMKLAKESWKKRNIFELNHTLRIPNRYKAGVYFDRENKKEKKQMNYIQISLDVWSYCE